MVKNINYFNLQFKNEEIRLILVTIVILVIILLFKNQFVSILEKIIIFTIIFLLILIISKNLIITIFTSCIVFLLLNLMVNYKNTVENFQNEVDKANIELDKAEKKIDEPSFDKSIFENDDFKKSTSNIQDLLKKINGGIELKEEDLKETGKIGIDTAKYSDDKKPNALKQAQKEAYELIDTVNALKDTVNTLAPVLQEGKKLMGVFENLKL